MNTNMKMAIFGAGSWGKNYVRIINKMGVLAAVADSDESTRKQLLEDFPDVMITGDYKEILKNSDINGIIVAVPAAEHYRLTRDALLAGKDVLVEKPMALSTNEARELVEIAENSDKILMVGHLLLYNPAVQKMIELVHKNVIGDIYFVEMNRLKLGKVRSQENVLWSFAPHDIAVLLSLVNSGVVKVTAVGMSALQPLVEDNVYLHIKFQNSVKASVHISWLWPREQRKTTIVGAEGMIVYDENEGKLYIYRKGVKEDLTIWDKGTEVLEFKNVDVLERQARHFLECIEKRAIPYTDGKTGARVIKIIMEASDSLKRTFNGENFFVHETACIDPPVSIGEGTQVWHFSHIMSGSQIGRECKIGQNVFIAPGVKMGNNVKIQNNVSVYRGVIMENNVFCGPSMVFTNVITPRSAYPKKIPEEYEKTLIKEGASIGANATILCGIVVGKYAFIGAGAVVTKDVPDHAVVYGNPGVIQGWICRCGDVIEETAIKVLKCDRCSTNLINSQPFSL